MQVDSIINDLTRDQTAAQNIVSTLGYVSIQGHHQMGTWGQWGADEESSPQPHTFHRKHTGTFAHRSDLIAVVLTTLLPFYNNFGDL